jgi:hypothetical protein
MLVVVADAGRQNLVNLPADQELAAQEHIRILSHYAAAMLSKIQALAAVAVPLVAMVLTAL